MEKRVISAPMSNDNLCLLHQKIKMIIGKSIFTRFRFREGLGNASFVVKCVGEKEEKELETWFRQAPLLELPLPLPLYELSEFEEEGFS